MGCCCGTFESAAIGTYGYISRCGFSGIGPTYAPGEGSSGFCSCFGTSIFSPPAVGSAPPSDFDLRRPNRKSIRKTIDAAAEIPTPAPMPAFAPVLRLPLPLPVGVGDAEDVDAGKNTTPPVPEVVGDAGGFTGVFTGVFPGVFAGVFTGVFPGVFTGVTTVTVVFGRGPAIVVVTTTVVVADT